MTPAAALTVCERLAGYACDLRYEDISREAVTRLKGVILHDLVVGIVGSESAESLGAVALVESDFGSSGRATIIRHTRRAAPMDAAFANAVMMRALRQEDTLVPAGIHAGVLTIPVALALGEHHDRSGSEVMVAIVAGYDVAAAIEACSPGTRTARTTSHVYGAFGAAVTAAKLMRLDREQTASAIAYAGDLGAMINAGFEDHQYGLLVRNGMTAAYLGRARAPAPRDAIEGTPGFFLAQVGHIPEDFSALDRIGAPSAVLKSALKPYPGAHANSVAITLMKDLVARHRLRPDAVDRILVHRPAESNDAIKLSKGPFARRSDAISSVPFAVAAVLLDGDYTRECMERFDDPAMLDVARRVDVATSIDVDSLFHRIEIHLRDGTIHTAEGDESLIASSDPAAIVRFHRSVAIDDHGLRTLAAAVDRLETAESVAEVTACL